MSLRQAIERYGVAIGVVVALTVTLLVLPGNSKNQQLNAGGFNGQNGTTASTDANGAVIGGDTSGGAGGGAGGSTATGGRAGGTAGAGGATAGGGAAAGPAAGNKPGSVAFGKGPHCRADGRQIGVSYAMPPCADWTSAPDNGGATARGVTKDKILIVRYLAQIDPGTKQILQSASLSDDDATVKRAYDALFRYGNMHYETYGRQVVMVDYKASGPVTSDEASRADAIDISQNVKPFAVIEGDPAGPAPLTFIKELARRNVMCFCSTSAPSSMYTSLPPIVFSPLPTIDEYVQQTAEYTCKHLKDKNSQFAGQGSNGLPRKYGLVYLAGQNGVVVPEAAETKTLAEREFAKCGITFTVEIQYLYDPGRNQSDVTNMIAQLKAAGVTTVVPYWDPLYPILITGEATRQLYFPEWLMTGTGLSDTTTAGRLYDQQQWTHAFGVSPLWVTWATVANSAGYREYHWARPDDAAGQEGVLINVYRGRIAELFTVIHMAGPNLTNQTAAAGAFAYPHTGGSAARPLLFRTVQFPTAIKDFTEVWYDANDSGPDERGKSGPGLVMKADNGRRFLPGQWYTGDPKAFVKDGAVAISDNPVGGGDSPTDSDPRAYPPTKACLSCP